MRTLASLSALLAVASLTVAGAPSETAGPPISTVATAAVSSVASTVKISYVASDLGNLGDATSGPSIAAAVNNRGLAVGTTRQADGFERAFRWDPVAGKMTDLGRSVAAAPRAPG